MAKEGKKEGGREGGGEEGEPFSHELVFTEGLQSVTANFARGPFSVLCQMFSFL